MSAAPDKAREPPQIPGVVSLGDLYTIDEARRRLKWTDAALRAAKRRGLRVLRSGKRSFVTGAELIRFIAADSRWHTAGNGEVPPIDKPLSCNRTPE